MKLTTLEQVKELAEIPATETLYDADLNNRIDAVSSRVSSFCKRNFDQQTYVEIHDGGVVNVFVDNPPIESVTEIVQDDFGDFDSGFVVEPVDYYIINRGWDIHSAGGSFIGGEDELRVTYIGGFLPADNASTTLPDDLQFAVATQVVWEFRRRKDTGLVDVSFPDGSIQKQPELQFLPMVSGVLKTYVVHKIG